ncbi:Phage baseplate assembly protein W [Thioalkalivibrio nitratireducens DSM 14787]|uniref:Phage baseplate assembly protein W n=1 Tax=Thioalkalivibrio nitratireducens (strain DSM 14787 / UNIQEM 213 / ALEN2) TaxID=1255043 RepID=L0DW22_THIND|nr:GPW/gp25 family protein [Thioalkalivibrio nitratireducens]AGA33794.1 Phage baseplate assembly protein W [Thioalkalivibrio nitratireducens DSM 14787]
MNVPVPRLISWPLLGGIQHGRLPYSEHDRSIREVMLNILLTRPGERLMRPDFGAGLLDFVHQPNTETTRALMARVVRKSLERWEPRVVVEGVDVQTTRERLSEVHLTVRYRLRHSDAPQSLALALDLNQLT